MADLFNAEVFQSLINKLKTLNCPFLGNNEEQWLRDLLLTPGQHRNELLKWTLSKLNITVSESHVEKDVKIELNEIFEILIYSGLCSLNDRNIVSGQSSQFKQQRFWGSLFDIILVCQEEILENKFDDNENDLSALIEELHNNVCVDFIDALVSEVKIENLFLTKQNLFPPDIRKEMEDLSPLEEESVESLENIYEKLPAIKAQENLCKSEKINLDEAFFSLPNIKERGVSSEAIQQSYSTFNEALSNFTNLEENFNKCYESLKPHLENKPLAQSELGPKFAKVSELQQKLSLLLSNINDMREGFTKWQRQMSLVNNCTAPDVFFTDGVLNEFSEILDSQNNLLNWKSKSI